MENDHISEWKRSQSSKIDIHWDYNYVQKAVCKKYWEEISLNPNKSCYGGSIMEDSFYIFQGI